MHFSIQQRFSIWAGLGLLSVVLMAVLVGLWQFDKIKQTLASQSYDVTRSQAEDYLRVLASDTSVELSMPLQSAMHAIQATASAIEAVVDSGNQTDKRGLAIRMLQQTLADHPDFLGTYVAFEPDAIDGADHLARHEQGSDATGRFKPYVTRDLNGYSVALLEGLEETRLDQNGIREGEYYLCSKESGESCVIDPYLYPVEQDQVLLSSLVAPIKQDGEFIGIAGVDISASFLQSVISDVGEGLYNGHGRTLLVSPRGIISGHSERSDLIGQKLNVLEPSIADNLEETAISGETRIISAKQRFIVLKPFHLPGNEQRWVAYLEVPEEIVMADVARQQQFLEAAQQRYVTTTIILGIFLSLLGVVTIWLVARKSIRPLNEMTRLVASIAEGEGDLTQRLNISYRDETGKLSGLLNIFIKKLQDMVQQLLPVASDVSSLSADGRKISVETSVQMLKLESLIEDMVLAMNEMAESAEQIAANAERTSQFVQHVNDAATSGAEMVQKKALSFNQDNGRQRAETGELAQQAEAVLSDINQAIAEVTDMTLQIASATEQQNAVCEEVNHNLTEVSRLVHQTSKGAQNLRGVGNQLDQAASRLQQKLSLFKV